jgi:hypothetical protein
VADGLDIGRVASTRGALVVRREALVLFAITAEGYFAAAFDENMPLQKRLITVIFLFNP